MTADETAVVCCMYHSKSSAVSRKVRFFPPKERIVLLLTDLQKQAARSIFVIGFCNMPGLGFFGIWLQLVLLPLQVTALKLHSDQLCRVPCRRSLPIEPKKSTWASRGLSYAQLGRPVHKQKNVKKTQNHDNALGNCPTSLLLCFLTRRIPPSPSRPPLPRRARRRTSQKRHGQTKAW